MLFGLLLNKSCFLRATLPWRFDWWSSAEMVFLPAGSPISAEDLLVWPLGSWSPAWSRPVLPGHSVWPDSQKESWYFQTSSLSQLLRPLCCFIPLPWSKPPTILSQRSTDSWTHGLVFILTCCVNCGTFYTHVRTFVNYVQSNKFATGGLQSSSQHISRIIKANRMHLTTIWSAKAKGLNISEISVFDN